MKKLFYFLVILILIPCFAACQTLSEKPGEPENIVDIDPAKTLQTIEGWGSSLCWWAGQAGNWEESRIDSLVEWFTAPDHLNMNIFRYNIGGGDDPSHIGGHMVGGKGKRAEMEGFKDSADAPYNWNADKAQRKIMLKIKEKRPDAVFEAFSNSPPYWMTYSGCSAGNTDPKKDNLKPEYYEAFCDYLVDVCKHYKQEYGIEFKTLEPFNESTSAYWNYLGSQEGCHFDIETQMKIIRILYAKLKASGLKTMISASDETNLASFIKVVKAYRDAGDILEKTGQLNTHTYGGSNDERETARELVNETGKEFWQSETGPMGLPRRAAGLENNLLLSQKLFDDMNIMRPQAWLDWQLMEENNDVWGLVRCNFQTQEYEMVKNFYVREQVTRFFRQGYILLETGCESALAALNPQKTKVVVALNNPSAQEESFALDLSAFEKTGTTAKVYRTSPTENCKLLPLPEIENKQITYTAPSLSMTTFIIPVN